MRFSPVRGRACTSTPDGDFCSDGFDELSLGGCLERRARLAEALPDQDERSGGEDSLPRCLDRLQAKRLVLARRLTPLEVGLQPEQAVDREERSLGKPGRAPGLDPRRALLPA